MGSEPVEPRCPLRRYVVGLAVLAFSALGAAWWLGRQLDGATGAAVGLAVAAAAILPLAWVMTGSGQAVGAQPKRPSLMPMAMSSSLMPARSRYTSKLCSPMNAPDGT